MSVISAVSGFGLGNLLMTAFGVQSQVVYWIVCIVLAAVGVLLTIFFSEKIVALFAAFAGAYLFTRGATLIFMGYPDPFSDKYTKTDLGFWLSVGGLVVITGLSTVY